MSIISLPLLVVFLLLFVVKSTSSVNLQERVILAINCGGKNALGAHGISYAADYLDDGVASDAGAAFSFNNAETDDVEIYQTERWSKESFSYEVPIQDDGEYVIILKFSEVYFQKPGQKVFNVKVNARTVAKNLDIFEAAGGRGFAHDIYVPIVIIGKQISVNGHKSKEYKGNVVIEFAKGAHDNPKVNAFAVLRGTVDILPPPPEKFSSEGGFQGDFDIDENEHDPVEDTFKPQIIRGDEAFNDGEMFSATVTGENENPFEKVSYVQESIDLLLPLIAVLIIIIPIAYVVHLRMNPPNT